MLNYQRVIVMGKNHPQMGITVKTMGAAYGCRLPWLCTAVSNRTYERNGMPMRDVTDDDDKKNRDIWVCLKIVYPYTQWLMIIIPIKWL